MADWMHGCFVKGVFQSVVWLLIVALRACKVDLYAAMVSELMEWALPRGKLSSASSLASLFHEKRQKSNADAKTFKCCASEGLSLYSLLGIYIQNLVKDSGLNRAAMQACKAYLCLCNLIDLLAAVALGCVDPGDIDLAVQQFLNACKTAGWGSKLHGKFYWLHHFADHLRQHGLLLACWVHERRHKLVKRYSNDVFRLQDFEHIVISEMVCHDLMLLREVTPHTGCALQNAKPATKKIKAFLDLVMGSEITTCKTSLTVTLLSSATCSRGDIVLLNSKQAAEIWLHCELDGHLVSLVMVLDLLHYDADTFLAKWQPQANASLIDTSSILCPLMHKKSDGFLLTFLPYAHRL